ncbi:MAG: type II toxin-antitoxin system VapC family toxin [Treponema sp.]|jgi:PIN domain nuclease of toxin-antitoxin system|nr:type II toxin-antitoxin system VapC family toxin [Treponema sp.]
MKLLIDTHILIWAAADTLPEKAVPYISDLENILLFSSASIWEVVIKKNLNRPDFTIDPFLLYRGLLDNGYRELDITSRHVLLVNDLPPLHKDPFDRILLAQAKAEGAILLTSDETVARYPGMIIHIS